MQTTESSNKYLDCVVVGAGLSGLTCAQKLVSSGVSVEVLEARDRVGGRAFTEDFGGNVVEIGCSWVHGKCKHNRVAQLCKRLNLQTWKTDWNETWTLDENGQDIPDKTVDQTYKLVFKVLERCRRHAPSSLRDAVNKELGSMRALSAAQRTVFEGALRQVVELDYGADVEELSACAWEDDAPPLQGGDHLILGKGYGAIVALLSGGLSLSLNSEVVCVTTHTDHYALLIAGTNRVVRARHVVVTVPLGVLQAGVLQFTPPLPPGHARAIASLGMGLLDKIHLRFARPFWPRGCHTVELYRRGGRGCGGGSGGVLGSSAGVAGERSAGDCDGSDDTSGGAGGGGDTGARPPTLTLLVCAPEHAPVLTAFCSGSDARRIESMPEEAVVELAMAAVHTAFDGAPARPEEVLVTRWGKDVFARGSYSYVAAGGTRRMRGDLAVPICGAAGAGGGGDTGGSGGGDASGGGAGVLLLAGEATRMDFPATAHGAIMSGEDAAKHVLQAFAGSAVGL